MRIAIVKLSALGDIVHAMVVLQFIKKYRPDVLIDWVVEESFEDVLANNPDIHQIHTVNLKQAKANKSLSLTFKELQKVRSFGVYDLVIDMQGLIKSSLVAKIIPSDKTFGFDKASLRETFSAHFYSNTCHIDYAQNIIKRNLAVVSSALKIDITDDDIKNKQAFLYARPHTFNYLAKDQPNVVLVLGASFDAKIYPIEQYAQVARVLDVNANIIAIWGNESEKQMAAKIQQITPSVVIADKLSLDGLKALIAQVDLIIGGDTGPTHMAWALNVPSIILFGATPAYRNTYQTQINKILESDFKVDIDKIDKADSSIKTIQVSSIVQMAKELLPIA